MKNWFSYLIERYPPLLSSMIIFGMSLTGVTLENNSIEFIPFILSITTIFYLTFLLRLDNDLKDYHKDRIAFPKRPLQRQLISKKQAQEFLIHLKRGLIVLFIVIFLVGSLNTRIALMLTFMYVGLLLCDFNAPNWLGRYPIIKSFSQQGFYFFLAILIVSIGSPSMAFSMLGLSYALETFGAFFTYEICRKLNPYAHPITMEYVHFYGFRVTFKILCFFLFLSAAGAYGMGVQLWLWPAELAVLFFLSVLFKNPKRYLLAELAAGLSLVIHVWAGPLQNM